MEESYSNGKTSGASVALARELMARLLPSADAEAIVDALIAERTAATGGRPALSVSDANLDPDARELQRVRAQLSRGDAAATVQHAMNNPLTALLAEAQLLELEPLAHEHRLAVGRIVELARRIAKVARRLDVPAPRVE